MLPIPTPFPVPTNLSQALHPPVWLNPPKLAPGATWPRWGDIPCVTRARQVKLKNPKENSGAQQRGSSSEEPLKWPAVDKAWLVMRPPPSPERAAYCHIMALRVPRSPSRGQLASPCARSNVLATATAPGWLWSSTGGTGGTQRAGRRAGKTGERGGKKERKKKSGKGDRKRDKAQLCARLFCAAPLV